MAHLVLIRHGQSTFNKKNIFAGQTNIGLSLYGKNQARKAGKKLRNYKFDVCYSSRLKRSVQTLRIILSTLKLKKIPIISVKSLNERHYGILTGIHKKEALKSHGKKNLHAWRYSYHHGPPGGESLKEVTQRTIPFFNKKIMKELKHGKNILVSAHQHSLRSIMAKIEKLNKKQILRLKIPNAAPIAYEIDNHGNSLRKKILK